MSVDIIIPGALHLQEGSRPLYMIEGEGYDVETLQEIPRETWSAFNSVGLKFPIDRDWSSQPLLLVTTYGGIVVESKSDGEFEIVGSSSQRTLNSMIVGLYKLAVPMMEDSEPTAAKILPPAEEETLRLLMALQENQFSLGQYLGQSPVSIKRNFIDYEGIVVPEAWVPRFENPICYSRANVVLFGRDHFDCERVGIASYNSETGELEAPHKME